MLRIVKVTKISPSGEIEDATSAVYNIGLFVEYDSAKKFFEYAKKDIPGSYALFLQKKTDGFWLDVETWSNVQV